MFINFAYHRIDILFIRAIVTAVSCMALVGMARALVGMARALVGMARASHKVSLQLCTR